MRLENQPVIIYTPSDADLEEAMKMLKEQSRDAHLIILPKSCQLQSIGVISGSSKKKIRVTTSRARKPRQPRGEFIFLPCTWRTA